MSIRDLIPVKNKPVRLGRRSDEQALDSVHREIDRMFSSVFEDFGLPSLWRTGENAWGSMWPAVNIADSEKEVVVTAELPGIDEKDVTLELSDDLLTIRGETQTEHEEKGRRWTRIERTSGSFHRVVELPASVREEGSKATFKRGVLTITLPKTEPQNSKRRIIPID